MVSGMMQHILISMRLQQWVKNFFLFAALLFAGHLGNIGDILVVLKGFFIFSITSSGVYLLNDITDAKNDRLIVLLHRVNYLHFMLFLLPLYCLREVLLLHFSYIFNSPVSVCCMSV